jgi:DNA polymerase-1
MKEEHKRIFDSLVEEKPQSIHVNSRVVLIDALNLFIRSFTVIQHMNIHGNHIGGLTGFLRSLGYVINLIKPTRIVIVFDGKGSSTNKRYLYPEYKANRGITRITNWDMFESQQEESEAIKNQIVRLIDYVKCLPVDMVSIDKIEADDVIGKLAKQFQDKVVIVSSDRDYLQLVSDKVSVYSPTKKRFYEPHTVKQEYGVSTENFLIQKVLLGDSGDNVPGVKGLGPKTLIKMFPELREDRVVSLDEVLEKCQEMKNKSSNNILNFQNQLRINEKLMDLHNPNISEDDLKDLDYLIENPNKDLKTLDFVNLYNEDSLGASINNLNSWIFNNFHTISKLK